MGIQEELITALRASSSWYDRPVRPRVAEARGLADVLGPIVLDQPIDGPLRLVVAEDARPDPHSAGLDAGFHGLRDAAGPRQHADQPALVVGDRELSQRAGPAPAITTMSHERMFVISRPMSPLPVLTCAAREVFTRAGPLLRATPGAPSPRRPLDPADGGAAARGASPVSRLRFRLQEAGPPRPALGLPSLPGSAHQAAALRRPAGLNPTSGLPLVPRCGYINPYLCGGQPDQSCNGIET